MRTQKYIAGITTLAVCIGGLIGFNAPAQDNGPATGIGSGRLAEQAKEKLGLTDEQLGQIKSVLKSEKSNIVSLLSRVRDSRAELREAIRATDANETSVRAASAKVATVEADVAVERMKLFHQISPILTDDQRAKLAALQSNLNGFIGEAINHLDARLGE
jgi:Spy/CpxP family protein refolding chaperone